MMRTYKGRPSVVLREIHDSYFLIDITARVEHDTSVIYQLDPMGALIWRELANAPTLDGLVKTVQTACMDAPDAGFGDRERACARDVARDGAEGEEARHE